MRVGVSAEDGGGQARSARDGELRQRMRETFAARFDVRFLASPAIEESERLQVGRQSALGGDFLR
jgi:hypothetical protein